MSFAGEAMPVTNRICLSFSISVSYTHLVGIQPDAGPSLIFITLPNVFQQAFSGVPILAYMCIRDSHYV